MRVVVVEAAVAETVEDGDIDETPITMIMCRSIII